MSRPVYRDVLGFAIQPLAPGWLLYVQDSCRIMAGECPDALPPREALRDEPWGMREFGLRTADGHRLMIGSPRAGTS